MWGVKRSDRGLREIRLDIGRIVADFSTGLHKSATRGRGIEFRSYREYEPSDSARDIAWRAMARLPDDDELLSKSYAPEREMRVIVVADESDAMFSPRIKPRYAHSLVRLFALGAFHNVDRFAIVGVGNGLIHSGWLREENDLDAFLETANDEKQRHFYRADEHSLEDVLLQIGLKNTLVLFLTDLVNDIVPFRTLREISAGSNTRSVAIIFDEWSGFRPMDLMIVSEQLRGGARAVLDMRKGGGVEAEVRLFHNKLEALREKGRTIGLSVITVPLAAENPMREFYRQWERVFGD